MPRSRPASDPLSFHKPTGQYYVTRLGKRIHLGANREEAMVRYHRLALGLGEPQATHVSAGVKIGQIGRFEDARELTAVSWCRGGECRVVHGSMRSFMR